jgi:hypothetical protein
MRAYCDRAGVIGFTEKRSIPPNTLLIASWDDADRLREQIEVSARHAYEPGVLLVPGVPEAQDGDKAVDAVIAFCEQIRRRLNGLPAYA